MSRRRKLAQIAAVGAAGLAVIGLLIAFAQDEGSQNACPIRADVVI